MSAKCQSRSGLAFHKRCSTIETNTTAIIATTTRVPVSHGAFQKSGATVLIVLHCHERFLASQCQIITGYDRAANEKSRATRLGRVRAKSLADIGVKPECPLWVISRQTVPVDKNLFLSVVTPIADKILRAAIVR